MADRPGTGFVGDSWFTHRQRHRGDLWVQISEGARHGYDSTVEIVNIGGLPPALSLNAYHQNVLHNVNNFPVLFQGYRMETKWNSVN